MKIQMTSISLVRVLGAALLVAGGCGSSSSAGPAGTGGKAGSGTGTAGSTATGSAGSGAGGTTGVAGSSGGSSTSGAGGSGVGGATGTGGTTTGAGGVGGKIVVGQTQCSDGIDNDGDGKIDLADPECVGPLDNDESSFATGIPGDNMDACKQDCFFDGNSGMGDDHCLWQLKCDPLSNSASCPYDQNYAQSHTMECSVSGSQTQACVDACQKLVPNGCDCFGCCVVPGASTPVRLAVTCTAKDFNDPTKCPPCTQVTQCMTVCGHCDYCIGKDTLPADCMAQPDGGTPYTCAGGLVACGQYGVDPTQCPAGTGCVTGCCRYLVP